MNEMKTNVIGLVAVVALIFTGFSHFSQPQPSTGPSFEAGAVSPFAPTPELNLGGLRLVTKGQSLATATSTVCSIQSPSATSTLVSGGVKFTLASTSAVVVDIAKGTVDQYSTTTRIGTAYSIAASAQATIVASSTGSVAGDATIFAPNQWFVVKYSDNNNGAGNASTGSCWAMFATP